MLFYFFQFSFYLDRAGWGGVSFNFLKGYLDAPSALATNTNCSARCTFYFL